MTKQHKYVESAKDTTVELTASTKDKSKRTKEKAKVWSQWAYDKGNLLTGVVTSKAEDVSSHGKKYAKQVSNHMHNVKDKRSSYTSSKGQEKWQMNMATLCKALKPLMFSL